MHHSLANDGSCKPTTTHSHLFSALFNILTITKSFQTLTCEVSLHILLVASSGAAFVATSAVAMPSALKVTSSSSVLRQLEAAAAK
jgi:hypothetical protein